MSKMPLLARNFPFLYSSLRMAILKYLLGFNSKEFFSKIFRENIWGDSESRSGSGSSYTQTAVLRDELPIVFEKYKINNLVDVPCGDMYWMKEIIKNIQWYKGLDIVPDLININIDKYQTEKIKFKCVDITKYVPEKADAVFCRDLLVHLSYSDIKKVLKNLKKSNAKYLLTTTFINKTENSDIYTGNWRPINFELHPFNFPPPKQIILENATDNGDIYSDKAIGIWEFSDLNI